MDTPEKPLEPEKETPPGAPVDPIEPGQPTEAAAPPDPLEPGEPTEAAAPPDAPEARAAVTVIDVPAPKPETRARRFFRSLARWLLLLVVLFGLGVAATYFWLYRPLTVQHAQVQGELQQVRQQLEQAQTELKTTREQVTSVQSRFDAVQVDVVTETNRANLQTVLTDVFTARLALANKDGANAQAALQAARAHLDVLMPAIQEKDPARAAAVSARLELVMNELNRDTRTAVSDLDILTRNLQELEQTLGIAE